MAYASTPHGLLFPVPIAAFPNTVSNTFVMDAATEKLALIGRLYLAGRTTSAKTLSTGSISFRVNTATFANGATTVDIGLQDVDLANGPIARPDDVFDVKTTLTGGAGITANTWNTATMTTGTKTMSHGDLFAVVFDMTARGGADTVTIANAIQPITSLLGTPNIPTTNAFIAGAWQTTIAAGAGRSPLVTIAFDDGTLGTIDGALPASLMGQTETYADATNPDERGIIFTMPWDCKVDGLYAMAGITDANSGFTLKLYEDATTAANSIASVVVDPNAVGVAGTNGAVFAQLATEVELAAGTEYCVSLLATGSTNARLQHLNLGDAAHRAFYPGSTSLAKGTRNDSTGNFTAASTVIMYQMGVRISQLDDGTGAGAAGGLIRHPGMAGGLNA